MKDNPLIMQAGTYMQGDKTIQRTLPVLGVTQGNIYSYVNGINDKDGFAWFGIKTFDMKPILYPIEYLTKEIAVRGYNNDKPFIPLVELAYIGTEYPNTSWKVKDDHVVDGGSGFAKFGFTNGTFRFSCSGVCETIHSHAKMLRLLYLWHIDIDNLIALNLAVSKE